MHKTEQAQDRETLASVRDEAGIGQGEDIQALSWWAHPRTGLPSLQLGHLSDVISLRLARGISRSYSIEFHPTLNYEETVRGFGGQSARHA